MSIEHCGPDFQLDADKAFIVLGHSERLRVGQLWATALDKRNLFEEIDVVTLNRGAAYIGRQALRTELKKRILFTHSAGIMRVEAAKQVVAINPPEQVGALDLLKRAAVIGKDPVQKEDGCHKTGSIDLAGAAVELTRSPISSLTTLAKISRGYSTTYDLSRRASDFPAGRAIVHSELDNFGFYDLSDLDYAAKNGVTTLVLPEHYHNEILFSPNKTLNMMTPAILPETPVD